MAPFLNEGDRLTIDCRPQSYRCGDILVVWMDGYLMAHRCIGRGKDGIKIKGDNFYLPDSLIHPSQIVGVVHSVIERSSHNNHLLRYRYLNYCIVIYAWLEQFLIWYVLGIREKNKVGDLAKKCLQPLYISVYILYEFYTKFISRLSRSATT